MNLKEDSGKISSAANGAMRAEQSKAEEERRRKIELWVRAALPSCLIDISSSSHRGALIGAAADVEERGRGYGREGEW